ncbi:MAG TPA: hypothetical protein VF238_06685 [Methylomirabilota bacterium]
MNTSERLDRLETLLADLAEEVGLGQTQHMRTVTQNKALAVLRELRPEPVSEAGAVAVGDICGKPQDKDSEESPVCLEKAGHYPKTGHRYGMKPEATATA